MADDLSKGYAHNVPEGRLHKVNLLDGAALDGLFSAFSFESVQLFQEGDYWRGALNVLSNVVCSLGATALGFLLAQELLLLRRRF